MTKETEPLTERITFRCTEKQYRDIKKASKELGTPSIPEWCRTILLKECGHFE